MVQSILVYSLLAISLFALSWHLQKREEALLKSSGTTVPFFNWEIITSILIFATVLGARYHTGYDHEMYLHQYDLLQKGQECTREFEPGFLLISKAFAGFGIHYFFYFALWATMQIGFVYYAFRDRKYLLPWIALLIVTGPYLLNWVNSMRQAVVACVFISLVPLINRRQLLFYTFAILLCATIHKSALLLWPVYFLPRIKPGKLFQGRKAHFAVLVCCILLGLFPFWIKAIGVVLDWHSIVGYEKYESMILPIVDGEWRFTNWGPSRIGLLLLNLSIIWYYPKLKQYYRGDTYLRTYFIFAFLGMCYSNLMMNTSFFLLRPGEYFIVFILAMLGYVMHYLYKTRQYIILSLISVVAFTHIYIEIFKAVYRPTRENIPVLYNFFFS